MSSSYKTNELNLSRWTETDVPEMADFNNDNSIIDRAVSEHNSDINIHITSNEREKWNNRYSFKTYSGNGNTTQNVNLNCGFNPSFCIVFSINSPPGVIDISNDTHYNYFGIASTSGSNSGLELNGQTLKVTSSTIMVNTYEMRSYNEVGRTYLVISFR